MVSDTAVDVRRSARAGGAGRSPFLLLTSLLLAALVLLPAAYLVIVVAGSPPVAAEQIFNVRTFGLLLRTAGLALAVTASTVTIAVPLAWLTARTDLPGRKLWTVVLSLPLVIPSYIGAYLLISSLGPKGLLQQLLEGPFGIERLPSIYGFFGAWLVLTLFTYPFVLLVVRSALSAIDPRLEEASAGLGSSSWTTFRTVVAPQLVPAVGAGALLVALYVLSDFGAVSLMQFDTFTRAIFVLYKAGFDRVGAAALALVLVVLTLSVLWLEFKISFRPWQYGAGAGGGRVRRKRVVALGRWKWPSLLLCGFIAALALAGPVAVLGYWTVSSLAAAVQWSTIAVDAGHSLVLGLLAAVAAVVCALPIALAVTRQPGRLSLAAERATYVSHALPGIVVALSLVFFGVRVFLPVYQKLPMLIAAYVVLFLSLAVGPLRSVLAKINPRVEEAARGLGRSPFAVLRTVTVPLAASGAFAGAALVFLTTIKELPATLLLAPIGYQTLATEIWGQTAVGFFERGAIPSLILLAVSAYPLYVLTTRNM